jgi:chromosome segregation ATPase
MNFVKKILVVHGAASARRRLMSLFADSGFDVRAFSALEAALENVRFETFDLAVVGHGISGEHEFSFIPQLKQIQARLPVMLLASKVELMLLQDLHEGLAGVLVLDDDAKLLMRKVRAELKVEEPVEVTPEDLAQVETTLQVLAGQSDTAAAIGTMSAQLARERAELDAWHIRLKSEEERSLMDTIRFKQENQQLAEAQQRFATDMERLREEENRLHEQTQRYQQEHQQFAEAQQRFATDVEKLHEEAKRYSAEQQKLAEAQQTFAMEMEKLRREEDSLRAQQELVKAAQKQAETEIKAAREAAAAAARAPSLLSEKSVFENEDALREAWKKFKREINILEAERAMLVDEKLVVESHQHACKQREEKVRDREIKVTVREKKLAEVAAAASAAAEKQSQGLVHPPQRVMAQALQGSSARPVPVPAPAPVPPRSAPAKGGPVKVESELEMGRMLGALTRAPFQMAKAVLSGAKKA